MWNHNYSDQCIIVSCANHSIIIEQLQVCTLKYIAIFAESVPSMLALKLEYLLHHSDCV